MFSTLTGYEAVCAVRLAAGDRAGLRRAVRDLEQFAFVLPLGRPSALRMRAALLRAEGDARAARAKLEKAILVARRNEMVHEAELAARDLG